jgi:hypothetical protein
MSKENPNQQYYKTAGRAQSDGPDRIAEANAQKVELPRPDKSSDHPAVRRAKKK